MTRPHYAMLPTASVSGYFISHPDSRYFGTGKIAKDQVEDELDHPSSAFAAKDTLRVQPSRISAAFAPILYLKHAKFSNLENVEKPSSAISQVY